MMPIVFCASLVPCMNPMPPALKIWATPKNRLTGAGRAFRSMKYRKAMKQNPSTKPASGEVTMGTMTFQSNPLPSHQCWLLGCDHKITFQLFPAAANAAPQRPPIKAWLELEGKPSHHVSKFQIIAPSKAQMMMSDVSDTSLASTSPEEIVLATAVPAIAPKRFVTAAITTAWRGVRTLVETIVAIELAVS